jgi:hypothetical protein
MAQNLPPEVGGAYYSRGAYKAGIRARGDLSLIPRPISIGWLIASFLHSETVGAAAGAAGLYDHVFTPGDTIATPHKWLTVQRMVSTLYGEQMNNARVGSFRLEINAANIVQGSVNVLGAGWGETLGSNIVTADEPAFATCISSVNEGGAEFIVDRVALELGSQLTDNEFRVGSFFLDDITQLQRAVQIQMDVRIKRRDLLAKVYRNSAAAPGAGALGSWSPTIYRSSLSIRMNTAETATQYLQIDLPGVDFLTLPVGMAGAELVRAQLTASVSLSSDNFNPSLPAGVLQPVTATLRNSKPTVYDWNS